MLSGLNHLTLAVSQLASRYGKRTKAKARRTISSTWTVISWSCTSATSQRLAACRKQPYKGMVFFGED